LSSNNHIEVDYLGAVGIRFENISRKDVSSIVNNFSVFEKELDREPEIIVRFVDRLETPDLIFLGLDYAAFDKENFYLISDPVHKNKVSIPFDKIGQKLEIICEKGVKSIPLLNHITNFYLIKNNFVPIHSSGFYFDKKGILVMGWTKGGKTETLLSFANHGAEYVGDEWVVLKPDGSEMCGLHVPVTIWKWQLSYIKKIVKNTGLVNKLVFSSVSILEAINNISIRFKLGKTFPFKLLSQSLPHLKKLLKIRKIPEDIFKNKIRNGMTKLDAIVLALSHKSNEIMTKECEPEEIIKRMIHSNDYEQLPFFEFYKAFKYAFPERDNEFLDNIKNIHSGLLLNALKSKKSFKIFHPYPVSFEALFSKLSSALSY
jgi:hypothetical protein